MAESRRLRVGCLLRHPAPYLSPSLESLQANGEIVLNLWYARRMDRGHPQWGIGRPKASEQFLQDSEGNGIAWRSVWRLWGRLRGRQYDVFAVSGYNTVVTLSSLLLARLSRIPTILVLDTIDTRRPWYKTLLRTVPLRLLYSQMSAFWVPGKASKEYLIRRGVPPEKIYEGCYCIDAESVARETGAMQGKRQEIRREFGLRPESYVFLMAARLIPTRRLLHLLQAFEVTKATSSNIELVVVGDGPERKCGEQYVRERGLKNVHFNSQVDFSELQRFYVMADAFVMPSIEPYSLAVAQAAVSAKPMVVADTVGAAKDYVFNGLTGYIYKYKSATNLASAMIRCAEENGSSVEMGRQAQMVAMKRNIGWASNQLSLAIFKCVESNRREVS